MRYRQTTTKLNGERTRLEFTLGVRAAERKATWQNWEVNKDWNSSGMRLRLIINALFQRPLNLTSDAF